MAMPVNQTVRSYFISLLEPSLSVAMPKSHPSAAQWRTQRQCQRTMIVIGTLSHRTLLRSHIEHHTALFALSTPHSILWAEPLAGLLAQSLYYTPMHSPYSPYYSYYSYNPYTLLTCPDRLFNPLSVHLRPPPPPSAHSTLPNTPSYTDLFHRTRRSYRYRQPQRGPFLSR